MSFEVMVALRYLRARRKQTFISLITLLSMVGVALGVCTLIVVLSVMNGAERELTRKILGMSAQVMVFKAGGELDRPQRVVAEARRDPRVVAAAPFVTGQVMLVSAAGASGAILRGLAIPSGLKVVRLQDMMVQGRVGDLASPGPDGLPGVILGAALARRLGVQRGARVNLINPLGEETPVGRVPQSEPFWVAGVFRSGMYQYDSALCYVSLRAAQELLGLGRAVSGVELAVSDIYRAGEVASRLVARLGPLYYARDWMSLNHSLFAALKLEKITMFVILILIVLVAAFGIVSSLVMLVMEKTRDIAILKAMGATAASVRRIFMLEGLIIGVCGTVAGVLGGLGLCALLERYHFIRLPADVYALDTLPVEVEPLLVGLVAVCAVVISLLATVYPAQAAARLEAAEALRYQ